MEQLARTLKSQKERGLALQEAFPFVRTFYRAGLSERAIAELIYNDKELCDEIGFTGGIPSLANVVRRALIGNPENGNKNYGPFYRGLLEKTEYDELSRKNRIQSGHNAQKRSQENKQGIRFYTREQQAESARASAESRGRSPWTNEEEIDTAYALGEQGYSHREIAQQLNVLYYPKKPKRTKMALDNFFRKHGRRAVGE